MGGKRWLFGKKSTKMQQETAVYRSVDDQLVRHSTESDDAPLDRSTDALLTLQRKAGATH